MYAPAFPWQQNKAPELGVFLRLVQVLCFTDMQSFDDLSSKRSRSEAVPINAVADIGIISISEL